MERGGMKEGWRKGGVLRGSWVGGGILLNSFASCVYA